MSQIAAKSLYPHHKQPDFPAWEQEILAFWKQQGIFEKSISTREGRDTFTFYEGPPSANGSPGIHHVMARAIKDTFCRYKTLQGYQVHRKGGWDTHGLPIELAVEKTLGITKKDIGTKITVDEYNLRCRQEVMKYKHEWDDLTRKMGYWVDLNDPYITFENEYIESVWNLLKRMYDKDLLYKGYTIQPYSPAAGTGLSSHELNQPGSYRNVKDTSCVAMFLWEGTENDPVKSYFLAWTTTPWTLPANAALAVGNKVRYADIETLNPYTHEQIKMVLAMDLVSKHFSKEAENGDFAAWQALPDDQKRKTPVPWYLNGSCEGNELVGEPYIPLFAGLPVVDEYKANNPQAFKIIAADFVTTEDGTGIVHISPTFGADDKRAADAQGIPGVLIDGEPIVDKTGKYNDTTREDGTPWMGEWAGRWVKNYMELEDFKSLDVDLCVQLKTKSLAFKVEKYEHNYPHCWRTDKPVLYYPLDSWFVATSKYKDKLVEKNKEINWKPASTGTGRFGNWLENLVDWNLSRSRYWGIPLPIWVNEERTEMCCIGSIRELEVALLEANEKLRASGHEDLAVANENYLIQMGPQPERPEAEETGLPPFDLHRPHIDSLTLADSQGRPMYREPDLIDVWFDSGSMPFAQWHYPFENEELFKANYPADFIAEGVDQTRGWFFTLHAISVLLEDSVAYKNVIANGLVLDKDGNKMSKRLGNAVNPFELLGKYGADTVRWYMLENNPPWENLRFNENHLQETQRKFFGTLINTYNFFALYANIDSWQKGTGSAELSELDSWVLSELNSLIKEVGEQYDDYDPTRAARAIQEFTTEKLSNWYVRLSRRRFWKGDMSPDKEAAYSTLHTCLLTISQLMSPIAPFFSDWLFRAVSAPTVHADDSVHLSQWPKVDEAMIDKDLEARMAWAMQICSLGHSIRKKAKIKARQPLHKVMVPVLTEQERNYVAAVAELVEAEINVKEVEPIDASSGQLTKKIKPNFKILGPKLGPKMKLVAGEVTKLEQQQILDMEKAGKHPLVLEGEAFDLLLEDVEITTDDIPGWSVATEGGVTVALDITLTEELMAEGLARDLVNRIQNLRKELGFEVTDHITVAIDKVAEWQQAIERHKAYICAETLADDLRIQEVTKGQQIEIDGITGQLIIQRV